MSHHTLHLLIGSSKELSKTKIPLVKPQVNHTFQSNHSTPNAIETTPKHLSESSFLYGMEQLKINKSTASMVALLKKNSSKLKSLPIPIEISKSFSNDIETLDSSSVLDQLNIGDNNKLAIEHKNFQFETELKIYHEHLKKYDEEAKDVINKFTASLDEKGKIIRKCEEDLAMFDSRVYDFQQKLEESLERTRFLESKIATPEESLKRNKKLKSMEDTTDSRQLANDKSCELQFENEKLKETITKLEMKLAKRNLHISNLKEILSFETDKIKQLNEAQEEILKLQRESIDKSNEISILRDELSYAAKKRSELINEYDEKIHKLKKLLAIREFLLIKERKS